MYCCNLPSEEIPEVDELAVVLILHVNYTPAVLAATDGLPVNDDVSL